MSDPSQDDDLTWATGPLADQRARFSALLDDQPDQPGALSRRSFLRLLGASMALAGAGSACTKKVDEKVVPYVETPAEVTPGRPLHFSTAMTLGGYATGLLVRSREGRPIKVEGNPRHPSSLGATGPLEQASLLSLYDPTRPSTITERGKGRALQELLRFIGGRSSALAGARGRGLRFLVEPSGSPLLASLRARLQAAYPEARFHAHAPVAHDAAYGGAALLFGRPLETWHALDRPRVIVALDADVLGGGPGSIPQARQLTSRRTPGAQPMNRLYAVECSLSLTGAMADHRLPVRSAQVVEVAIGLLREVSRQLPPTADATLREGLARASRALSATLAANAAPAPFLRTLAADLLAQGGGLVLAGLRQPPLVHALAGLINQAVGAAFVTHGAPVLGDVESGPAALAALVHDLGQGAVDTLVMTAFDPVSTAPADSGFHEALARVPHSIYLAAREDATARASTWFVPQAHYLESWGDARSQQGAVSLVQPLIAPLYGGITEGELWSAFLGEGHLGAHAILRRDWRRRLGDRSEEEREALWERSLGEGLVPEEAIRAASPGPTFRPSPATVVWQGLIERLLGARSAGPRAASPASLELNFYPDAQLHDGRFASNAWLQELPDPVTKVSWGNAVLLGPATARTLGVQSADLVTVVSARRRLELPVFVLPGHAENAASVSLGHGLFDARPLPGAPAGSAYTLRTSDGLWFTAEAQLQRTGRTQPLAQAQIETSMQGRPLALETTLAGLAGAAQRLAGMKTELPSLYEPPPASTGYRWGMAIDLARCTGCSACVVACQSENNVPVVGREQVLRGREMHWLRIDRYFTPTAGSARMITQPLMCVHCEKAPCEYVCPVNATVHSDEGLNEMVYNRCVGTRYCSNNCPYKVRRFNYYAYTSGKTAVEKLAMNPEVTVRSRGVMEKCTYCVQRIEAARIESQIAGRPIADGEVVTACAQVCPTQAIVFGSYHDPQSQVSHQARSPRSYQLLHELGTRPRTFHLLRVRNPNPELG